MSELIRAPGASADNHIGRVFYQSEFLDKDERNRLKIENILAGHDDDHKLDERVQRSGAHKSGVLARRLLADDSSRKMEAESLDTFVKVASLRKVLTESIGQMADSDPIDLLRKVAENERQVEMSGATDSPSLGIVLTKTVLKSEFSRQEYDQLSRSVRQLSDPRYKEEIARSSLVRSLGLSGHARHGSDTSAMASKQSSLLRRCDSAATVLAASKAVTRLGHSSCSEGGANSPSTSGQESLLHKSVDSRLRLSKLASSSNGIYEFRPSLASPADDILNVSDGAFVYCSVQKPTSNVSSSAPCSATEFTSNATSGVMSSEPVAYSAGDMYSAIPPSLLLSGPIPSVNVAPREAVEPPDTISCVMDCNDSQSQEGAYRNPFIKSPAAILLASATSTEGGSDILSAGKKGMQNIDLHYLQENPVPIGKVACSPMPAFTAGIYDFNRVAPNLTIAELTQRPEDSATTITVSKSSGGPSAQSSSTVVSQQKPQSTELLLLESVYTASSSVVASYGAPGDPLEGIADTQRCSPPFSDAHGRNATSSSLDKSSCKDLSTRDTAQSHTILRSAETSSSVTDKHRRAANAITYDAFFAADSLNSALGDMVDSKVFEACPDYGSEQACYDGPKTLATHVIPPQTPDAERTSTMGSASIVRQSVNLSNTPRAASFVTDMEDPIIPLTAEHSAEFCRQSDILPPAVGDTSSNKTPSYHPEFPLQNASMERMEEHTAQPQVIRLRPRTASRHPVIEDLRSLLFEANDATIGVSSNSLTLLDSSTRLMLKPYAKHPRHQSAQPKRHLQKKSFLTEPHSARRDDHEDNASLYMNMSAVCNAPSISCAHPTSTNASQININELTAPSVFTAPLVKRRTQLSGYFEAGRHITRPRDHVYASEEELNGDLKNSMIPTRFIVASPMRQTTSSLQRRKPQSAAVKVSGRGHLSSMAAGNLSQGLYTSGQAKPIHPASSLDVPRTHLASQPSDNSRTVSFRPDLSLCAPMSSRLSITGRPISARSGLAGFGNPLSAGSSIYY